MFRYIDKDISRPLRTFQDPSGPLLSLSDHPPTTQLPRVVKTMAPWYLGRFQNCRKIEKIHQWGRIIMMQNQILYNLNQYSV